jgi:exodeoxyribonuclease-5
MSEVKLNGCQEVALNLWIKFIRSKATSYCLQGYAGTGKSFVTKYLLDAFEQVYGGYHIKVTAPTHEAKNILSEFTGKEAVTIQSFLGLKPATRLQDIDLRNIKFVRNRRSGFNEKLDLLVVDEFSMLPLKFAEDLIEICRKKRAKILFVGDLCQLPPVNDTNEGIVKLMDVTTELTEVVRYKDKKLELATYIRENLNQNAVSFDRFIDNKSICKVAREDLNIDICDPKHNTTLAYTRRQVADWNQAIRREYNPSNELINDREILLSYSNYSELHNSEKSVIDTISKVYLLMDRYMPYTATCERAVSAPIDYNKSKYCRLTLNKCTDKKGKIYYILDPESYDDYKEMYRVVKEICTRSGYMNKLYSFLNIGILSMQDLVGEYDVYIPKGIDYGYARTIHKSQGSTYPTVVIDVMDIWDKCGGSVELRNRLMYVAVTRASEKITFVI